MYELFYIPAVSLLLILVISLSELFHFRKAKPMLEQIEEARQDARCERELKAYQERVRYDED